MTQAWDRMRLAELAAGKTVYVCTPEAGNLPVPAWLAAAARSLGTLDAGQRIGARHPADQHLVTDAWLGSLARPGELLVVEYRTRPEGRDGWWNERVELVNLVDHPEVAGVVMATDVLGPCEVDDGDAGEPEMSNPLVSGEFDAAPWLLYWLDDHGQILDADGSVAQLMGISADEAIGRSSLDFVHPEAVGALVESWLQLLARPNSTHTAQWRMVHPDGSTRWVEVTTFHRRKPGRDSEFMAMGHDISDEIAHQEQLQASNTKLTQLTDELSHLADEFRLLADQITTAVFRCDDDGTLTFHNARWSELAHAVCGDEIASLDELVAPADVPLLLAHLERIAASGDTTAHAIEVGGRDGRSALMLDVRLVRSAGSELRSFVGSVTDMTATVQLRRRAEHDALTGLLNRQALEDRLSRSVHPGDDVLVVFLDLDGFKAVNDTFGHDAGDEVLEAVAHRLNSAVRPGDEVCRYGGDEFVIICHDAAGGAEAALCRRIEQVFTEPVLFSGGTWVPAASLGTARPVPGEQLSEVVRRADLHMFDAKRARKAQGSPTR